jgi:hypothetical protein
MTSTTMNQSAERRSTWLLVAPNEPTTETTETIAGSAIRLMRAPAVGSVVLTLEP